MAMATEQQPIWVPYEPTRDCNLGRCSIFCPQWCYTIFPPPPTVEFTEDSSSSTTLSPLVVVIIGILASAFLLASYYTFVSKYCGSFSSLRGRRRDENPQVGGAELGQQEWPSGTPPDGLDEMLINKIAVRMFCKGDGFVVASDCSVCLSEFKDQEMLRLLPKCSHAFHAHCIDTWLKSHSSCPLCRASITPVNLATVPVTERSDEVSVTVAENEALSTAEGGDDTVVEIRDDGNHEIEPMSIADVLQISSEEDEDEEDGGKESEHVWANGSSSSSTSRRQFRGQNRDCSKSRGLHCVLSPVSMKRSMTNARSSSIKHTS